MPNNVGLPPIGAVLQSVDGERIKILGKLGDGGQGVVYKVDYSGKPKALKWYYQNAFDVCQKDLSGEYVRDMHGQKICDQAATENAKRMFYENLKNNIAHGAPCDEFLWPQDITPMVNDSFGYIMDIRPPEYQELSILLIGRKASFASFQARIDGMLNLVNAFRVFHNKGYNYQDLNDGNFFFNPETGAVLICDNDNAAYQGYNTGIVGKCRFMAPEVVLGQKMPDTMTDRFSMAVILFFMLFRSHPLEGAEGTPACMTPSVEKYVYGSHPVFVFDPDDRSNRPVRGVADHSSAVWDTIPQYVKDAFIRSFSKGCMEYSSSAQKYGAARLTDKEWIDTLMRFRNEPVLCAKYPQCKGEVFYSKNNSVCPRCKTPLPIAGKIQLPKYQMVLHSRTVLYKAQVGSAGDAEALEPVGKVMVRNGQCGLVNVSGDKWLCAGPSGTVHELPAGAGFLIAPNTRVQLPTGKFELV